MCIWSYKACANSYSFTLKGNYITL
jgi:hypothetical protein